jgi:uncharacterized protein YcbK (DUF882 family)
VVKKTAATTTTTRKQQKATSHILQSHHQHSSENTKKKKRQHATWEEKKKLIRDFLNQDTHGVCTVHTHTTQKRFNATKKSSVYKASFFSCYRSIHCFL